LRPRAGERPAAVEIRECDVAVRRLERRVVRVLLVGQRLILELGDRVREENRPGPGGALGRPAGRRGQHGGRQQSDQHDARLQSNPPCSWTAARYPGSASLTSRRMPDRLHFSGNDEADRLLAEEPMALLIGFALDQQVPVPTAFAGPLKLKQRIGTLDPGRIAATDPGELEAAFREKPAIHRFPGAMAARVQELAAFVADRYDGRAERLWTEAADGDDLRR